MKVLMLVALVGLMNGCGIRIWSYDEFLKKNVVYGIVRVVCLIVVLMFSNFES